MTADPGTERYARPAPGHDDMLTTKVRSIEERLTES